MTLGRRTTGRRAGTVATDDAHRAGSVPSRRFQGGHGVIRVGVVGAAGRMGREVARAVTADPDLELVAAVDPSHAGQVVEGMTIADTLDALTAAGADVAVEFTRPTEGPANISWCVAQGIHVVSGTTGFDPDPTWSEQRDVGVFIAPNFAIGAVLMQRFAEQAIRYLPDAEIIELHHHDKPDAPSGTAMTTARRMAAARGVDERPSPVEERVRRRSRRRRRRHPRSLGPAPRARGAPGGHPRRPGADAHDPSRLHRLDVVHAGRRAGGEGRRPRVRASRSGWTPCWGRSEHRHVRGLTERDAR